MGFAVFCAVCGAAVVALLASGPEGSGVLRPGVLKPLAASCFVAAAVAAGCLETPFGAVMLVGFALSWCGDVLLLWRGRRPFLAGLVAFLLAHLVYAAAFGLRGVSGPAVFGAAAAMAVPAAIVSRWLWPHLGAAMKGPVVAYMVGITAMVALAVGTAVSRGNGWLVVGAVAFYLSDLAVARDRFVVQSWTNKLWGWPLYFGGQLVLAWCAGQP